MKKENTFYLIFISTIFILRTWVFFFPFRKIWIDGILIHHFYIGLLLLIITILLQKRYKALKEILLPIAYGFIVDELVYILTGGVTVTQYWASVSVYGMIIVSFLVFVRRKNIVNLFIKNN